MKNYLLIISLFILFSCQKENVQEFPKIEKIYSVKAYDDIRWKDLTEIKDQLDSAMIRTLTYNESTVWPSGYDEYAEIIMEEGRNPGLGIRKLHESGITGEGVVMAIIDQNLCSDYHAEYEKKILQYFDAGCNMLKTHGSMHGPAVTSLLAGETIGVAPGAKLLYAAAPSWLGDSRYFADALNWIIEKNKSQPQNAKIRIVSVSAAPSGTGSPFTKNNELWDIAVNKAQKEGIMVIDCGEYKINHVCYYNYLSPEDVAGCKPGFPNRDFTDAQYDGQFIYVPSSFRTTAEQYRSDRMSFQYYGNGGMSWSVPYLAGVLALGWQVDPTLSKEDMVNLLFESAFISRENLKIIDPQAFIEKIKENKK